MEGDTRLHMTTKAKKGDLELQSSMLKWKIITILTKKFENKTRAM